MKKLTIRDVDALLCPPEVASIQLWDGELRGFGVRAFSSGTKKFIVQYRTRSGQQRRMTLGAHGTLTLERARTRAKAILGRVAEGFDPAGENHEQRNALTVDKLCDLYVAAAEAGLVTGRGGTAKKQSTMRVDRGRIERHIKPLLGRAKAIDVRPPDIERVKNAIAVGKTAANIRTGPRGLARVSGGRGAATRTLGLLGSIFNWAVANGHVTLNPVRGVRRFADKQKKALLTADQYRLLGLALTSLETQRTMRGDPAHHQMGLACIRFIALTGLRRGEAVGLRWSEVDLERSLLLLGDTKTRESIRPLGGAAIELLRNIERTGEHVFASYPGGPAYGGIPRLWKKVLTEAEQQVSQLDSAGSSADSAISDLTLHGLRHSYAGVAESMGGSLPTIATLLGHRLGGVTADYILKRVDVPLIAFADRVSRTICAMLERQPQAAKVVHLQAKADV